MCVQVVVVQSDFLMTLRTDRVADEQRNPLSFDTVLQTLGLSTFLRPEILASGGVSSGKIHLSLVNQNALVVF